MKKIKISILFILLGFLAAFGQNKSDSNEIGFCDFNKVLASTKAYQDIQNKTIIHEKEMERLTKEVSEKVEKFKSSGNDPKIQSEAQAAYEKMEKYKMTAYEEVEKLKQRFLPDAQKKIISIIKDIGEQRRFKNILDAGIVLYSNSKDNDITEMVITEIKKIETQVNSSAKKSK